MEENQSGTVPLYHGRHYMYMYVIDMEAYKPVMIMWRQGLELSPTLTQSYITLAHGLTLETENYKL